MPSKTVLLMLLLLGSFLIPPARSQEPVALPLNQLILAEIKTMPSGGGYSAGNTATQALRNAVRISNISRTEDSRSATLSLVVDASRATPSYCSGATYLVFLKVIAALQASHNLTPSPSLLEALRPMGQPDGTGIWGRWNANGPGTARLFAELGLGPNFTDYARARPGDFLKIWWGDFIGASEHGHSVIYMGTEIRDRTPYITYWSSNVPGGFGTRSVPLSRIHRMLFSRLENPEALTRADLLPLSDHYLFSLQTRASTPEEMNQLCRVH